MSYHLSNAAKKRAEKEALAYVWVHDQNSQNPPPGVYGGVVASFKEKKKPKPRKHEHKPEKLVEIRKERKPKKEKVLKGKVAKGSKEAHDRAVKAAETRALNNKFRYAEATA